MSLRIHRLASLVCALALSSGCTFVANPAQPGYPEPYPQEPSPPHQGQPTPPIAQPIAQPVPRHPATPVPRKPPSIRRPFRPIPAIRPPFVSTIGRDMSGPNVFGTPQRTQPTDLQGLVFWIPETSRSLPDLSKLHPVTHLYKSQFDIASRPFNEGFPGISDRSEWFAIQYTGDVRITTAGIYAFRLISDEGVRVYLDNTRLLDGNVFYDATQQTASVTLAAGTHHIVIDYYQARGNVALQLFVTPPNGTERVFRLDL